MKQKLDNSEHFVRFPLDMKIRQSYQGFMREETGIKRNRNNLIILHENITNTATNGMIETPQDIVPFLFYNVY